MFTFPTDTLNRDTTQSYVQSTGSSMLRPDTEIYTGETNPVINPPDFSHSSGYNTHIRPLLKALVDGSILDENNPMRIELKKPWWSTCEILRTEKELKEIGFKLKNQKKDGKPLAQRTTRQKHEVRTYTDISGEKRTVQARVYSLDQAEPFTGIELNTYIILQYIKYNSGYSVGKEIERGVIPRVRGSLNMDHFAAHVNGRANSHQRHYTPGQRETNIVALDIDCHREEFIPLHKYVSRIIYEELVKLPPIFTEKYTPAHEYRNNYRSEYTKFCFENPVDIKTTYHQIKAFLYNIIGEEGLKIVEIFPNPYQPNHLFRCPLAPTHDLVLNGQIITNQKEKINAFANMCMGTLIPAAPLPWETVQAHNEKNYEKIEQSVSVVEQPVTETPVEQSVTAEVQNKQPINQKKRQTNQKRHHEKKIQNQRAEFKHVFNTSEENPNFKDYMRNPAEICTISQADVNLTSFAGYALLMLQRKTGNHATYEMLLKANTEHNALYTTQLSEKQLQKVTKSIFAKNNYYYTNHTTSYPNIPTVTYAEPKKTRKRARKARTPEDELARQIVVTVFYNSVFDDITKSINPLRYVRLLDIRNETYAFIVNNDMLAFIENKNMKALSHIVADPYRWSFFQYIGDKALKTVGTRRKINGVDEIVYMGYELKGHTHSAYNEKTHWTHITHTLYYMMDGKVRTKQFPLKFWAPTEEEAIKTYYRLVAEIQRKEQILQSTKNRRKDQANLYAQMLNMTQRSVTNKQNNIGVKSESRTADTQDAGLTRDAHLNKVAAGLSRAARSNKVAAELSRDAGLVKTVDIEDLWTGVGESVWSRGCGSGMCPSGVYLFCYMFPAQTHSPAPEKHPNKWKQDAERRIKGIFMRRHGFELPEYYKSRAKK